jgi:hypothetical protein
MTVMPGEPGAAAVDEVADPARETGGVLVRGLLVGGCDIDREIAEGAYGEVPSGQATGQPSPQGPRREHSGSELRARPPRPRARGSARAEPRWPSIATRVDRVRLEASVARVDDCGQAEGLALPHRRRSSIKMRASVPRSSGTREPQSSHVRKESSGSQRCLPATATAHIAPSRQSQRTMSVSTGRECCSSTGAGATGERIAPRQMTHSRPFRSSDVRLPRRSHPGESTSGRRSAAGRNAAAEMHGAR